MNLKHLTATLALSAALTGPVFAQSNQQAVEDAKAQAKQDHKVDKSQAKADKAEAKAMNDHKVKKAAKKQDKADHEAEKALESPK